MVVHPKVDVHKGNATDDMFSSLMELIVELAFVFL